MVYGRGPCLLLFTFTLHLQCFIMLVQQKLDNFWSLMCIGCIAFREQFVLLCGVVVYCVEENNLYHLLEIGGNMANPSSTKTLLHHHHRNPHHHHYHPHFMNHCQHFLLFCRMWIYLYSNHPFHYHYHLDHIYYLTSIYISCCCGCV